MIKIKKDKIGLIVPTKKEFEELERLQSSFPILDYEKIRETLKIEEPYSDDEVATDLALSMKLQDAVEGKEVYYYNVIEDICEELGLSVDSRKDYIEYEIVEFIVSKTLPYEEWSKTVPDDVIELFRTLGQEVEQLRSQLKYCLSVDDAKEDIMLLKEEIKGILKEIKEVEKEEPDVFTNKIISRYKNDLERERGFLETSKKELKICGRLELFEEFCDEHDLEFSEDFDKRTFYDYLLNTSNPIIDDLAAEIAYDVISEMKNAPKQNPTLSFAELEIIKDTDAYKAMSRNEKEEIDGVIGIRHEAVKVKTMN